MSRGGYQPTQEQIAADKAALEKLRADLNADANSLVPALFPAAVRAGRFWEMGDSDGNRGQAFKINADGKLIGIWTDFKGVGLNGRPSGDMLSLIVHRRFGGNFAEAMKALRAEHGLGAASPEEQERWAREAAARRAEADRARLADVQAKAKRAASLWHGAVPIKGTPALAYLEQRKIEFGALGRIPGALRYRPDVKFCPIRGAGPDGTGFPAMLACVIGPGGDMLACHGTFLDISRWDHAAKRGPVRVHKVVRAEVVDDDGVVQYLPPALLDPDNPVPGKMKSHKATLGAYASAGGYIPLRKGASGKRLAEIPAGLIPRFSEGIEDGLSYALLGHLDDWIGAAVSLANMANLRMPAQAGGIAFLADRNDNATADEAFERAVAAQQMHFNDPRKVLGIWPSDGFSDFNNELCGVKS